MAEQARRKRLWTPLSRFEQIALASTILIWVGVILFGVGLYVTLCNFERDQASYAQGTAIAGIPTKTVIPPATVITFPSGWSTATPTPTQFATTTTAQVTTTTSVVLTATPTIRKVMSTTIPASTTPSPRQPQQASTANAIAPPASQPPSRLIIPAIKLDSPVVPVGWHIIEEDGHRYSVWQVADYVVGWHKTSVYPGHASNMVLSGHHNIKGESFRYLVELEVGNRVLVYSGDQVYHYAVTEKYILKEKGEPSEVRRQNAKWIAPTQDERLTMVTCWPYTNNTHRLVVVARPIQPPNSEGLAK